MCKKSLIIIVTAITMFISQVDAMQYQEQQKVLTETRELLKKAEELRGQKKVAELEKTLQQGLDTISKFRGKSGQMPTEINPIISTIDNSIKAINDFQKNPWNYQPGQLSPLQLSTLLGVAIKTSDDALASQEAWLPLE